eukprot:gb/GEZN01005780.1/.p1 GENE.gb/GEZN01005780.1/~~gb/GEZN01005780.1/.p1  ORF type:complete len:441 (+),score=35.11 gb/GEZN01005780.1/:175-1497(+)
MKPNWEWKQQWERGTNSNTNSWEGGTDTNASSQGSPSSPMTPSPPPAPIIWPFVGVRRNSASWNRGEKTEADLGSTQVVNVWSAPSISISHQAPLPKKDPEGLISSLNGLRISPSVNKNAAPPPNPQSLPNEVARTHEMACNFAIHGVDARLKVVLAAGNESMTVMLTTDLTKEIRHRPRVFEGLFSAEGLIEAQDVCDAFEAFRKNAVQIHFDKLKVTGVGFQIRLKEVECPLEQQTFDRSSLEREAVLLRTMLRELTLELRQATNPVIYEVSSHELESFGWKVDPATSYSPEGKVPEDDMLWRGGFMGKVVLTQWCGRVMFEGQVSGVGPGLILQAQRRVNTLFSEVDFMLFRLPAMHWPSQLHSFSRRVLDTGEYSSDYCGGFASGSIGYRPLRRVDVRPDGFVVLVCFLCDNSELQMLLRRPTRWCVNFNKIAYFL